MSTPTGLNADALSALMLQNLATARQAAGYGPLPPIGTADRKMLFDAIAQAVVTHLQQDAIVSGTVTSGSEQGETIGGVVQ